MRGQTAGAFCTDNNNLTGRPTMQSKRTGVILSRRQALGAMAGATGLLAAPAILRAQSPLTVKFVQQRGLLYIPVDIMVSGGILQQEATKLGLGKIEATATALSGPGPILDALLSGAADYGTAALPSLLTLWEKTHGTANEVKAVGTVSNGAITLYTINPNVKTIADFTDTDRIAVPTVRLSFNAMMLQMAAEQLWNDPHRLDHLTVALGHPDAVTALSAGYGKATITAHAAVQPLLPTVAWCLAARSRKSRCWQPSRPRTRTPPCSRPSRQRSRNRSRLPTPTSAQLRPYGRKRRRRPTLSTIWWLS
jgi:hypothetical protein